MREMNPKSKRQTAKSPDAILRQGLQLVRSSEVFSRTMAAFTQYDLNLGGRDDMATVIEEIKKRQAKPAA